MGQEMACESSRDEDLACPLAYRRMEDVLPLTDGVRNRTFWI